jgi:hypothetical protein
MGIKDTSNKARIKMVPEWLADLRARVAQFDIFGLHLIDHPIAGLADEFAKFHDILEKASAKIEEMNKEKSPQVGQAGAGGAGGLPAGEGSVPTSGEAPPTA